VTILFMALFFLVLFNYIGRLVYVWWTGKGTLTPRPGLMGIGRWYEVELHSEIKKREDRTARRHARYQG